MDEGVGILGRSRPGSRRYPTNRTLVSSILHYQEFIFNPEGSYVPCPTTMRPNPYTLFANSNSNSNPVGKPSHPLQHTSKPNLPLLTAHPFPPSISHHPTPLLHPPYPLSPPTSKPTHLERRQSFKSSFTTSYSPHQQPALHHPVLHLPPSPTTNRYT